ncbi:MAG: hypothetical protein AAF755_13320 [Pseudomonadota bacterium]
MLRSTVSALFLFVASTAQAADVPPAMTDYINNVLKGWVNDPAIVTAINEQNNVTGGLSSDDILAKDLEWRAQVGAATAPLIDNVLNADLSSMLKSQMEGSGGRILEVFVMDGQGLNVASSGVTSDYWQGDEAKFTETFGKGPGSVFVDEVELDESTQAYQGQVSFAITDPATGDVVGAITVGLNASAFF